MSAFPSHTCIKPLSQDLGYALISRLGLTTSKQRRLFVSPATLEEITMPPPSRMSRMSGLYEALGELVKNPKSLGLRETLPPPVLAVLTSTREVLREQINRGKPTSSADNDLAAELSQDTDTPDGL